MIIALFILSIFGGFLSGFLGLGGAVVMIPLMLTIPPLFNIGNLTMKSVAGLSMVQVFFSSISGIIIHKKNNFVHYQVLFFIGIPMGIFSLLGSYFSKYLNNEIILVIFAIIILLSFILLLLDNSKNINYEISDIIINKKSLIITGIIIGTASGIVGAGGGFILIPIMTKILKIPLKITIGTSLGIVFIGALFGSLGKLLSFQVDFLLLFPVIIGSLIAAQIGARVSKITPPKILKTILFVVILISFIQVIIKLI
jgi:uncharacterized membrane protein YfcA